MAKIICTEEEERQLQENCKWDTFYDTCVLFGICAGNEHPLEGVEIEVIRDG